MRHVNLIIKKKLIKGKKSLKWCLKFMGILTYKNTVSKSKPRSKLVFNVTVSMSLRNH